METKDILKADVLDILFDGRHKDYGAYQLRKQYPQRIKKALLLMALLTGIFSASILFGGAKKDKIVNTVIIGDVSLADPPAPPPPPPPSPPLPPAALPDVKTVTNFIPEIVKDNLVNEQNEVKPVEEIINARIGNKIIDGPTDGVDIIAPPVEKTGTGKQPSIQTDEAGENSLIVVQIPAEFPGGLSAWKKFLERNLNNEKPVSNGAPVGKYTVLVSFVVAKDGAISDVKAENNPGYGTAEEAVRVIQKGPNWKPAVQNGRNVVYHHKQSIVFQVNEE